ncbi:hypothetical protein CRV00_06770 [Malaciobacter molluscorum]|nr:hypothetical protein CRV00_06770 [Malaciobacter molluscorum]
MGEYMKYTQIRNATSIIEYANKRFLIDPLLAPKESYDGFAGTLNSHLKWPRVELPFSIEKILEVDAIIITHLHKDHFDDFACKYIPKKMQIFCQDSHDKKILEDYGFKNITVLCENTNYYDIKLSKTKGQHGTDDAIEKLKERLGEVCGIVFQHKSEKTLYLAGDTLWNRFVEESIEKYKPELLILSVADAINLEHGSIIMGKTDLITACKKIKDVKIIANHLEAVNHTCVTRDELKKFILDNKIDNNVLIPNDGDTCNI